MEKIIELAESTEGIKCLICCERAATLKLKIKRPKHEDMVSSFHVCDRCLAQMQKEIQIQE